MRGLPKRCRARVRREKLTTTTHRGGTIVAEMRALAVLLAATRFAAPEEEKPTRRDVSQLIRFPLKPDEIAHSIAVRGDANAVVGKLLLSGREEVAACSSGGVWRAGGGRRAPPFQSARWRFSL